MKFKHKTLTIFSGAVWLIIGIFLLSLGIHFVLDALRNPELMQTAHRFSILNFLGRFIQDRPNAVIILVTAALMLGYFKGKMVLAKSVSRQIKRIATLPNPSSLKHLYSKAYYLLIASMIGLGMLLRFCPITIDTRGAIDMVIGSALINGAMLYFRHLSSQAYQAKRDASL